MARTNWKDRVVERPRTFTTQNNPDGTITLVPSPGQIIEAGTPVNAENLNALGVEFDAHLAEIATETELGHIKLSDIPSPEIATQSEAEEGISNEKFMTPLRASQLFDKKLLEGYYYYKGKEPIAWVAGNQDNIGSLTKEISNLKIVAGPGGVGTQLRTYVTDVAIDLTNINTLKIEWDSLFGATGAQIRTTFFVGTVKTDSNGVAFVTKTTSFTTAIDSLSVSSLTGLHFIKIDARATNNSQSVTTKVYRVWGE